MNCGVKKITVSELLLLSNFLLYLQTLSSEKRILSKMFIISSFAPHKSTLLHKSRAHPSHFINKQENLREV